MKNETQSILLNKLEKYFSIVRKDRPTIYHPVDVKNITDSFEPASCSGLVALWFYYMCRGKKEYFYNAIMAPVFAWNGRRKTLSKALEDTIEYSFSCIGWLQASSLLFEQATSGEACIQQSDYDTLINTIKQDDYPSLRKEYEISFVWRNNELKEFLQSLPANKLIRLSSAHAIGLFFNGNTYILFDSNGFARPLGNRVFERQFALNKIAQLITNIQRAFFYAPRSTVTGLIISIFDTAQNPIPVYLDKTEKIRQILDKRFATEGNFHINEANPYDNANSLYFCAEAGDLNTVKLLLSRGANAAQVTDGSWGPIHIAIQNDHWAVVKELLESKQGKKLIHTSLENGDSPLYLAANNGRIRMVRLLLRHGANAEQVDSNSWGPIHIAAQEGHFAIVEALLNSKVGNKLLDAPLQDGKTPLVIAAKNGHVEIVKLLLSYGAKSKLPNNWATLMKLFEAKESEQFESIQKAKNEIVIVKNDSHKDYNKLVKIKAAYLLIEHKIKTLDLEIRALSEPTCLSTEQAKITKLNHIKKEAERLQTFVYFKTYNIITQDNARREKLISDNEKIFVNLFNKIGHVKTYEEKTETENQVESPKKRMRTK